MGWICWGGNFKPRWTNANFAIAWIAETIVFAIRTSSAFFLNFLQSKYKKKDWHPCIHSICWLSPNPENLAQHFFPLCVGSVYGWPPLWFCPCPRQCHRSASPSHIHRFGPHCPPYPMVLLHTEIGLISLPFSHVFACDRQLGSIFSVIKLMKASRSVREWWW